MLLKSICNFDRNNHFQNIFVLFSELVAVCTISFVSVCKRKIISDSEKNDCIFWFISSVFIYLYHWILFDECYFRIAIFWFCIWFFFYICLFSWFSHHDLHVFMSLLFCELLHLFSVFIKNRNNQLLIW